MPYKIIFAGIEINPEIFAIDVSKKREKLLRGFLTGFQRKSLTVFCRVITNTPHYLAHRDVVWIARIARYEANMSGNTIRADCRSKINDSIRALFAYTARELRNETDGAFNTWNVGIVFADVRGADAGRRKIRGLQRSLPLRRAAQIEIPSKTDLSAANSEALQNRNCLVWVFASPEQHRGFQFMQTLRLQTLHLTDAPFCFLDSRIRCISATACADSCGGQRSGARELITQPAK